MIHSNREYVAVKQTIAKLKNIDGDHEDEIAALEEECDQWEDEVEGMGEIQHRHTEWN